MIPASVLLENSLNLFYVRCDNEGKIEYTNELFSSFASHIQPENIEHFITHTQDQEEKDKAMKKAVDSSPFPVSFQCRLNQKNGAKRWSTWEIAHGKGVYHMIGIQLFDVVSITAQEYEEQQRLLEKISWVQSHKVRKPLANILALSELISKNANDEDKLIIKMLYDSSKELDEVVKEIVELSSKSSK
jgi:light-regulated signal transduction histidine kinase (bacteriophytochrome)